MLFVGACDVCLAVLAMRLEANAGDVVLDAALVVAASNLEEAAISPLLVPAL